METCDRCGQDCEIVKECPRCEMSLGKDCCYRLGAGCLCDQCDAEDDDGSGDD